MKKQISIGNKIVKISFCVESKPVVSSPDQAYIELNNLYLQIERGLVPMTIWNRNRLCELVEMAYPDRTDPMRDWWLSELEKLPGYLTI